MTLRTRPPLAGLLLAAWFALAAAGVWLLIAPTSFSRRASAADEQPAKPSGERQPRDPAAWGSDHVDQPVPDFVEGGECLFCHRNDVGRTWSQSDRHSQSIRESAKDLPPIEALAKEPSLAALAAEVSLVMGHRRQTRFLKRGEKYGHLDLLSVGAGPSRGTRYRLNHTDNPHWDDAKFAGQCAGCHTTGVDPQTSAFTAVPIDCFSCHGDAPLEHSNDASLMPLAKARRDPPEVVIGICAQCHVRFGKSRATGRPYPANFVAGDNLFKDFEIDWERADDPHVNPADRHVLDNVREVALYGGTMTCLSCHDVHAGSSRKHRDLSDGRYCGHCHEPDKPKSEHILYEVHSQRCEY